MEKSQNGFWKGFLDYYKSNGTESDFQGQPDHWRSCYNFSSPFPGTDPRVDCFDTHVERDQTPSMFGKGDDRYMIAERCNYVSNVAYYHGLTRLCDYPDWHATDEQVTSLKRAYATHVVGSHFWHGSHTYMGGRFDTHLIAAIMYSVQDVLVGGFAGKNTILTQLSEKPRSMSAGEFAGNLTALGMNAPPTEWTRFIVESDYPQDYFTLFAAFIATVVSLILPWNITNFIITELCNLLVPDSSSFITQKYLPAL